MKLPSDNETLSYFIDLAASNNIDAIILSVCLEHGVSLVDLFTGGRPQRFVEVRAKIAKIALSRGYEPPEIADMLGVHRTTVRHYLEDYQEP